MCRTHRSGLWIILRFLRGLNICCRNLLGTTGLHLAVGCVLVIRCGIDSDSVLVVVCRYFDAEMLRIRREPYASPNTILFQRLSVIVTDIVLFAAIQFWCSTDREEDDLPSAASAASAAAAAPKSKLTADASKPTDLSSGEDSSADSDSSPAVHARFRVELPTPQAFQARRTLTIVCTGVGLSDLVLNRTCCCCCRWY